MSNDLPTPNDGQAPDHPQQPDTPPIGAVWTGSGWELPPTQAQPTSPPPMGIPQPAPLPADSPYAGKTWDGKRWVNPDGTPFTPAKKPLGTGAKITIGIGIALVVVVIGLTILGNNTRNKFASSTGGGAGTSDTFTAPDPTGWIPTGYKPSNDPNLAWRWHDANVDCGYHDSCAAVDVVTDTGCPNGVFVEMAEVDATGALLNNSNDIGPALAPGGKSVITVGWLDSGSSSDKVQVTRMSCM